MDHVARLQKATDCRTRWRSWLYIWKDLLLSAGFTSDNRWTLKLKYKPHTSGILWWCLRGSRPRRSFSVSYLFYLKPGRKAGSGSHSGGTQVRGRWDWGKKLQRSPRFQENPTNSRHILNLRCEYLCSSWLIWQLCPEFHHSLAVWSCCILLSSCIVSSSPLIWLLWRRRIRRQVRWFRAPAWETVQDEFRGSFIHFKPFIVVFRASYDQG